ncbi:Crp/Fnr family transcriptional regulator [Ammoniphilus sp. CFH 90114]|uniref:Crp/Fnr family transcriptional regulator n=1 Tax=Ammoniphilus sp. CFH 90114 TaxID=2493665 RepID=UPI0013E921CB|nr:Crp/Fnr family transcriptional regulator [Ammoniphilus sp. CFH 90114]
MKTKTLITEYDSLSPWLDELPFQWTTLEKEGQLIELKKGEVIFHSHQPSESVYIVKAGRIRLFSVSELGDEKAIAIMGRNGLLGECSLFQEKTYSTNAVTASPSQLIKLTAATFMKEVLHDPTYCLQVWEMMSVKIRLLSFHTTQLAFRSSFQRTTDMFLQLGLTYGDKLDANRIHITIPFTHQEMANLVGATRVTIANHIRSLLELGVISKSGKEYTIQDLSKLLQHVNHPRSFLDYKREEEK